MGGGGYVAGPVGAGRADAAHPARADRGRQPPRPDQPAARPLRAARLPGVPARRAATGRRYRVTGRPIPPPAPTARGARARFGIEPEETCVLVFGGSLGARSINLAALEAFAGAPFHVLHVSGRRDHARAGRARAAGRATTCASTSTSATSPTRSRPPTWWSRARAARCSRSPRTGCRRSSCPTRTPSADHRARTRAGWPTRARRW